MLFRGMVEMLPATIRGMGREARCHILARRRGAAPVYEDCSIIGAPEDLPDGEYGIEFGGTRAVATKRLGVWGSFDPPLEGREEPPVLAE